MSMQKQELIPGGRKSQGEVSIVQYDPDPVEHSMEGKKRFLEEEIVRGRPTTPNVIMALLKANSQQNPGPVEDALLERETTPDGWNSKREARNSQHDLGVSKQEMEDSWWME